MTSTKWAGFVGTYTKGESEGVYSFVLDTEKEKIMNVQLVANLENPTYLAICNDNKNLYAVAKEGDQGGVVGFRIDENTHKLVELNKGFTAGSSPCYVATNSDGSLLTAAYYHRGTVELYTLNEDGSLDELKSTVVHEGKGPNPERQEKPHTHYADFTPDEKYVVAVDLGIDQLITYEIVQNELVKKQTLSLHPGCGPRHLTFHPNGRYAYLMTEISSEVIVLEYHHEDGSFKELQYISTIPEDFQENNQGSAIHITSDGKFVYVSNRGHNSLAIFQADRETGMLSLVDFVSSEGDWPRDFILDPSENYLVGSNQESNNLVLYKRDKNSGKLTLLQKDVKVGHPVCVKFMK